MRVNTNSQDDMSLDQLINIINVPKKTEITNALHEPFLSEKDVEGARNLPPIESNFNKINKKPQNDRSWKPALQQQKPLKPKTLVFKPWSGKTSQSYETYIDEGGNTAIKEEIQDFDDQIDENSQRYQTASRLLPSQGNNKQLGYLYRFQGSKVKLIKCLLDQNGFKEAYSTNKNWTIYWSTSVIKQEIYRELLPYQKTNHFPNSFHLTRKDLMNKSLSKMQQKYGITHFNFLPKTYILPNEIELLLNQMNSRSYTYIVKPHNRSQGKGITVTTSLETIYSKLEKYSSLIVSHYISNPLLINKLKFDLRIYVALTSINPLRIYIYEEGLARFATEQYDEQFIDPQAKKYQHLTNYSINKKNNEYISSSNQNEEYYGSKWRLTALKSFLAYNIGNNEVKDLFERIDEVIVKTIISGENSLYTAFMNNVPYINGCFEILGFDVMIDSNLKPWLIEVNMSPSMNTDSPLDLKIKGNAIADLYTLVGIVPLEQRYLDGGHSTYETKHYTKSDEVKTNSMNSGVDRFILKEVQNEYERSGSWRRVFPDHKNANRYKNYFEKDRYFNRLVREKLLQSTFEKPTSLQPTLRKEGSLMKKQRGRQFNSMKPIATSNKSMGSAIRINKNKNKLGSLKNKNNHIGMNFH